MRSGIRGPDTAETGENDPSTQFTGNIIINGKTVRRAEVSRIGTAVEGWASEVFRRLTALREKLGGAFLRKDPET